METILALFVFFSVSYIMYCLILHQDREARSDDEQRLMETKSLDSVFVFKHPPTSDAVNPYIARRCQRIEHDDRYMIGVRNFDRKFFFGNASDPFDVDIDHIAKIELICNDRSIAKAHSVSQFAETTFTAPVRSDEGASSLTGVIGSSRHDKISSIVLKIEIEHPLVLSFRVNFYKSKRSAGEKATRFPVRQAILAVDTWYSILERALTQLRPGQLHASRIDQQVKSLTQFLGKLEKPKHVETRAEIATPDQEQRILGDR